MAILVTGGAGYIGSHTIIELINAGYEDIISVDNFSNSSIKTYDRIEKITSKKVKHFDVDLTDQLLCDELFKSNSIDSVIHFAAYKSVPESVEKPLLYYKNNLAALLNVLEAAKKYSCHHFIFSSSCSVYGNTKELPVTENTELQKAESPYAQTKVMGEKIITDFIKSNSKFKCVILRYFNPVGSHVSGLNGEITTDKPNNLVPFITETAIGIRESLKIFGGDYNTKDGTCIRDYIHVSDIANAHILALQYIQENDLQLDIFNLGTGQGVSVLEIVKSFERVNDIQLNYEIVGKRDGDVEAIYANNDKANKLLNWKPKYTIDEMMESAWKWQKNLSEENQ